MSILDRLFRRGQTTEPEEAVETPPCVHIALSRTLGEHPGHGRREQGVGFHLLLRRDVHP